MESEVLEIKKLLYTSLNKYSLIDFKTSMKYVLKLLSNIIENPEESKYRKFNKNNDCIKAKILNIKESEHLLKLIGYEEQGDNQLVYEKEIEKIKVANETLKAFLNELKLDKNKSKNIVENEKPVLENNDICRIKSFTINDKSAKPKISDELEQLEVKLSKLTFSNYSICKP